MEKKKEGRKWEKFKINLQIQPFDFEISCSKYQKKKKIFASLAKQLMSACIAQK